MLRAILKPVLKPSLNPILGGDIEPVVSYVARTDGATQCWQLDSPLVLDENSSYEIGYYLQQEDSGNLLYLMGYSQGSNNLSNRLALSSGDPQLAYGLGFSGDEFSVSGGGLFTLSHIGSDKTTTIQFGSEVASDITLNELQIDRIGGPWKDSSSGYLRGYIKNFYVIKDGVEIIRIPLTNKEQGATQSPIVGSVSATMLNYTSDVWEIEP